MKLLPLGTAGYHPNEQRHTACYMLPELGVVLDAGTGMFRVRKHLETPTLDIFLSHAHLDHVVGLTYLLGTLYGRSMERVTVHGEAEKLAAIQTHLLSPLIFPAPLPCEYAPLRGPVKLPGNGVLRHFPLLHPGGTVGFRIDWPDRSLAYITDTTADPTSSYVEQIKGVSLLLHECNFISEHEELAKKTGHSHASAVAHLAVIASVERLVLTHVNPLEPDYPEATLREVQSIFPTAELGADGVEIEF